jgi:hypothetical protein
METSGIVFFCVSLRVGNFYPKAVKRIWNRLPNPSPALPSISDNEILFTPRRYKNVNTVASLKLLPIVTGGPLLLE